MYIRRKLYSNINGEIVPINQTKHFSEEESNGAAKGAVKGAGVAAGAAGLGAAGIKGASGLHDLLKGKREAAIKGAEKANGEATRGMLGKKTAEAQEAYKKTLAKNNAVINANKNAGSVEKTLGKAKNIEKKALGWLKVEGKGNRKISAGLAAAGLLAAGAGAGAGVSYLKGKKKEKVYSVLMTEEELRIFADAKEALKKSGEKVSGAVGKTSEWLKAKNQEVKKVAEKASNKTGNVIKSGKNWFKAKDLEGKILRDKKGRLLDVNKEINRVSRNRKVGAGLAAAGTIAAGIGAGVALKGKKDKKKKD